jgi:hypothetical protein
MNRHDGRAATRRTVIIADAAIAVGFAAEGTSLARAYRQVRQEALGGQLPQGGGSTRRAELTRLPAQSGRKRAFRPG